MPQLILLRIQEKLLMMEIDTNLLCLSNSIKKLNKLVNADLKHLVNWLSDNKIVKKLKW